MTRKNAPRFDSDGARISLAWIRLCAIAFLSILPGLAAGDVPAVYHSPGDDGVPAPPGFEIPPSASETLHLYLDGGGDRSSEPACYQGTGDEVCGFELSFEAQGGLVIVDFVADAQVTSTQTATSLDLMGGDPWRGEVGARKLGDLTVDSSFAGSLVLLPSQSVDASLALQAIPTSTIPEPGFGIGLVVLVLAGAAAARRRRLAAHGARVLVVGAALIASVGLEPGAASAQGTPICGDVVSDDVLDLADLEALEGFLANDAGAPDLQGDAPSLARCDVVPNGACDIQDYARIRRYMLDMPGGMDETCTGILPGSVVLPAPTIDQPTTTNTARASVLLTGSVKFPSAPVVVTGGYGRFVATPGVDGLWAVEVPLRLAQSNNLSIVQSFGAGYASEAASIVVNQTSSSGTATLDGRVVDAQTGAPILQSVSLDVSGAIQQTDETGRFEVADLPEGLVFVKAEASGYAPEIVVGYAGAFVRPAEDLDPNYTELAIGLTARSAPVVVDSAGGTVATASGVELVVPPGSLPAPTSISVTDLTGDFTPNSFGRPLVEIGPVPTVFDPPAVLRVPSSVVAAGTTADLVQVDHANLTVAPLVGTSDGSGYIEVPISASNGDNLLYEYSTTFIRSSLQPTVTTIQIPFVGSCTDSRDEPILLSAFDFAFQSSPSSELPAAILSDLGANPRQIQSGAPNLLGGLGNIHVPQGEVVVYEFTVTSYPTFERVFQFSLAGQPVPEEAGVLIYQVPQEALPNLVASIPLPCTRSNGSGWGDPHLVRFDHVGESLTALTGDGRYDFQAAGEFVFYESTEDGMVVQTRFEQFPANPSVTITTAAAMDVAGDRVMVDIAGGLLRARVDGVTTTLTTGVPVTLSGGGELERLAPVNGQDELIVRWPDTSTLLVTLSSSLGSFYLNLYPDLAPGRFGKVRGLLGNANGIMGDGFELRDGTPADPADLYTSYANSWRLSQVESLFDYEPGEDTSTYDGTPPDTDFNLDDLDPAERAAAEATCIAAGLDEDPLLSECALDVALLGGAATGSALDTLDQVPERGTYVAVAGQASIFQAGQSSVVDLGGGGGAGLLPTEVVLAPGVGRSLRVLDSAGAVSFSANQSGMTTDGVVFGTIEWGSWNGLAGPRTRRIGQVMGVFLEDTAPSPGPGRFDCGSNDGDLSMPEIGEVFCLGDGLSASETPQAFFVPDAATRLFLGFADRLASQMVEPTPHHLGDNFGTGGLFALDPNPEGVSFVSNTFDLPTGIAPSSGRVLLDLVGTDLGGNTVRVNGQFVSFLPVTGADITTWVEDLAFTVDPSILLPTGNTIEVRSSGGNLDDFLFQNLRFEIAPPATVLPEPSDPTAYHLGDLQGQFIGDGVGAGNWGLFALMPIPYGTSWTSAPFDVADIETLGGASVVIDIAQTDRSNNLVLVNGTAIGTLPVRPDGTVWSTDEEISFDPGLLEETGNRIEVRSGYLVAGLAEVDDFMMRNARIAVAPASGVPPGGYSDNAGVHEFIIEVSP